MRGVLRVLRSKIHLRFPVWIVLARVSLRAHLPSLFPSLSRPSQCRQPFRPPARPPASRLLSRILRHDSEIRFPAQSNLLKHV
ncbi:hypothetical protein B0H14DRAFT_2873358, partial [Mycena olivaceomarginata]